MIRLRKNKIDRAWENVSVIRNLPLSFGSTLIFGDIFLGVYGNAGRAISGRYGNMWRCFINSFSCKFETVQDRHSLYNQIEFETLN